MYVYLGINILGVFFYDLGVKSFGEARDMGKKFLFYI